LDTFGSSLKHGTKVLRTFPGAGNDGRVQKPVPAIDGIRKAIVTLSPDKSTIALEGNLEIEHIMEKRQR
jgi:hypothetical protein